MIVVPCYLHYNISLQSQFIKKKKMVLPPRQLVIWKKKFQFMTEKIKISKGYNSLFLI